ncbi:hypothetical protein LXL04_020864 [Taraxacum kok-saghyz]
MTFVVGEKVEFTGIEPGFTRAIYSGSVIRMGGNVEDVVHDDGIGADRYPSVDSVGIVCVQMVWMFNMILSEQ